MATKLEKIKIDEVSGVDAPANLADGWLLTKAVSDAIDAPESDDSVLKRVAAWFRKAEATSTVDSEEEIQMTEEQLTKALEEQTEAIGKSVGEAVAAALEAARAAEAEAKAAADAAAAEAAAAAAAEEAPAEPVAEETAEPVAEAPAEAPAAEAPTVSAEDFAALGERVEAIAKAVENMIGPLQGLVAKSASRTSLPEAADAEPVAKAAEKKPGTTGIFERLAAGESSVHIGRLVS